MIESRHLAGASRGDPGAEIPSSEAFRSTGKTLDIDGILALAQEAPELETSADLKRENPAFGFHTDEKYASVWLMTKRSASFMQIISVFWNRWVQSLYIFPLFMRASFRKNWMDFCSVAAIRNYTERHWRTTSSCAMQSGSYCRRNALSCRMWRLYVSSSGDGNDGWKIP